MVIFKNIVIIFLVIAMLSTIGWLTRSHHAGNVTQINKDTSATKNEFVYNDQYKISHSFTGNKTQVIDLRKGLVKFGIKYDVNSHFSACLHKASGELLDTIVCLNGPYGGNKILQIQETGSYLLSVRCTGKWTISQE